MVRSLSALPSPSRGAATVILICTRTCSLCVIHYRNHGLGRRLKLAQREDAIAKGFELLEWTFDPLEIKNAHLNLARLGAIARRYSVNHYGFSSSPLQGGLPTDRLVAEWWIKSRRVLNLLEKDTSPQFTVEEKVSVPAQIYDGRLLTPIAPKLQKYKSATASNCWTHFAPGLLL